MFVNWRRTKVGLGLLWLKVFKVIINPNHSNNYVFDE
jgi:hypothetical protein